MGRTPGAKNKPKPETATADDENRGGGGGPNASSQPTGQDVAIFHSARLKYHPAIEERFGVDKGQWKVLVEAIYPAAKTEDAVVMALSYCKARNLDPFKRPVHIVPMWDSARGGMVETVWPGISELRTTASRTKGYAGCDEAEFGPTIKKEFKGRIKERGGEWKDLAATVEYPEWCRLTVYRIVEGQRCKFVGPKVKWAESYATVQQSDVPNTMWQDRPEGQLEKCAEAAALRRAFPEELGNELTAEEMEGRRMVDLSADVAQITPAAASRDAGPPRAVTATQPPAGEVDLEQARDGTPPPRNPPKADPISSGPPRQVAEKPADKPATDKPAKKGLPPEPFRIPGTGHSFESWTEQYIDLIRTSPDTATAYKWIDVNTREFIEGENKVLGPLQRLERQRPSVFANARKAAEQTIQALRDAAAKAEEKATKKAAKESPPPASDMDDGAIPPDQFDELTGAGSGPDNYGAPATTDPDDVLKWIRTTLATCTEPEDLENIWSDHCLPHVSAMQFPPDKDEALAIYREHEKRLEP